MLALTLLACGCTKAQAPDAGRAAPAPAARAEWPKDLTQEWVRIHIRRSHGGDDSHVAMAHLGDDGLWKMDSPFHGDADPDAVDRLRFVLKEPQVIGPRPLGHKKSDPVAFQIDLTT